MQWPRVGRLAFVSPALPLSFPLMNLFCLRCKKQPRHGHGQASGVPTLSTLGVLATPSVVPTPNIVPIARSTPDTPNTSHPVDSEVLAQGLAPITAE